MASRALIGCVVDERLTDGIARSAPLPPTIHPGLGRPGISGSVAGSGSMMQSERDCRLQTASRRD